MHKTKSRVAAAALTSASALALTVANGSAHAQIHLPTYNWSGFYGGVNVGAIRAHSDTSSAVDCNSPPGGTFCGPSSGAANAASIATRTAGSMSETTVLGGIQAGYNWQYQRFVAGFEADIDLYNLSLSRTAQGVLPDTRTTIGLPPGTIYTIRSGMSSSWLATVRGRVGVAFDTLLVYATGGLAVTRLKASNNYADTSINRGNASNTDWKYGWVVGGGLEWAVLNNWSVKAEYLYVNFGKVTAAGLVTRPPVGIASYSNLLSTTVDLNAQIARVGLNYHF